MDVEKRWYRDREPDHVLEAPHRSRGCARIANVEHTVPHTDFDFIYLMFNNLGCSSPPPPSLSS